MSSIWARIDVAQIIVGILVSIPAALLGALIKGYFARHDREEIQAQRDEAQRDRDDARRERAAAVSARDEAHNLRDRALRERQQAIEDLARREAEIERQRIELERLRIALEEEREKLNRLLTTLRRKDAGLWTTFAKRPPPDFDRRIGEGKPKILTVANNKGGVGKTTVVGNLLAHFDKKRHRRVLAIDMDYQGSLSTMMRSERDDVGERSSSVNALLALGAGASVFLTAMRGLGEQLTRSKLVPAFYELALLEDRLMVEWLLQEHDGDDMRYRLARVLLSPEVQELFDLVLIDVPPRLSAGTINALCASTHVLVPTMFNPVAAEPVENFLTASTRLMNELNPNLQFIGVLETMAPPRGVAKDSRAEGRRVIQEALNRSVQGIPILQSIVPQAVSISKGGVAYLRDARARRHFDVLGDEISARLGL